MFVRGISRWCASLMVAGAVCVLLLASPAAAQDEESLLPPEDRLAELLNLAEAYQVGYLQVVAVSCYQLYATTGIIATDFANGYIDAETALGGLDENSLLHSVCHATLRDIQELTPAGDQFAHDELARLLTMLTAEQQLLAALREVMVTPTDENAAIVEAARLRVEQAIADYVATAAAGGLDTD